MKTLGLLTGVLATGNVASQEDEPPRGFLGGGIAVASRDAGSQMRLWSSRRLGLGAAARATW
jgi:hypothetical protein